MRAFTARRSVARIPLLTQRDVERCPCRRGGAVKQRSAVVAFSSARTRSIRFAAALARTAGIGGSQVADEGKAVGWRQPRRCAVVPARRRRRRRRRAAMRAPNGCGVLALVAPRQLAHARRRRPPGGTRRRPPSTMRARKRLAHGVVRPSSASPSRASSHGRSRRSAATGRARCHRAGAAGGVSVADGAAASSAAVRLVDLLRGSEAR